MRLRRCSAAAHILLLDWLRCMLACVGSRHFGPWVRCATGRERQPVAASGGRDHHCARRATRTRSTSNANGFTAAVRSQPRVGKRPCQSRQAHQSRRVGLSLQCPFYYYLRRRGYIRGAGANRSVSILASRPCLPISHRGGLTTSIEADVLCLAWIPHSGQTGNLAAARQSGALFVLFVPLTRAR